MANYYKYLIIGGGIAGVTAAETIREKDPGGSIAIIASEPYPLYSRVLLPAYLKRKIPREKLLLRTVNDFVTKGIDLHLHEQAVSIDPKFKEVKLETGAVFRYEKLLLAAGGTPTPWGNEEDQGFIYRLQTLDDADRLHHALAGIRRPIVVGSSFISLELLEIFLLNGITPQLLMRDNYFFEQFIDKDGADILHTHLQRHGIIIHAKEEIARLTRTPEGLEALAHSGRKYACDAIAVGVGIDRNTSFLRGVGIILGERGVRVTEHLESTQADIYAAGDLAEFHDPSTGTWRSVGNWTNAFLQGRTAGLTMSGTPTPFRHIPSYSISNFGVQITVIGDCTDISDTIIRQDSVHTVYERLFLRNGMIAGAFLLNRFNDKVHITKLIESKTPVAEYREHMADISFDLMSISVL